MTFQEIQNRLQEIFNEIFIDEVLITPSLSANDVDEWDSLLHISIVVAVEKKFGIKFKTGEVEKTKNVGEFMELIGKNLA